MQWIAPPPGRYGNAAPQTIIGPGLFNLDFSLFKGGRGRKADPIPGRIFQRHQSPQLRPAQHEYFFVAYDSRRHCGSDYRNRDDGAADTIGPEAHLLTLFAHMNRLSLKAHLLYACLLVAICAATYWTSHGGDFFLDDQYQNLD